MILDAKEVRYMADTYYNDKLPYIMKCIKNASYSGNYDVTVTENIEKIYEKLIGLGYSIETIKSDCIYKIGW